MEAWSPKKPNVGGKLILIYSFEIGSLGAQAKTYYVAEAYLELLILLSPPPKC